MRVRIGMTMTARELDLEVTDAEELVRAFQRPAAPVAPAEQDVHALLAHLRGLRDADRHVYQHRG